jgi:molecular chaperone DnaJ
MKKYYNILGLQEGASEKEIKNAYRKLSKEYHPDITGGDDSKFKEISEAYAVLTGKEKPKEDPYTHFRTRKPKPRARQIDVNITIKDAYNGGLKNVKYKVYDKCHSCDGAGGESPITCNTCQGSGFIRQHMFMFNCHTCNGRGVTFKSNCRTCNTTGRVVKEKTIEIDIPKYCTDRMAVIANGYGDYVPGMDLGDVIFIFNVVSDGEFTLEGLNVKKTLQLSFGEFMLGCQKEIETLDSKVRIDITKLTQINSVLRLRGKGFMDNDTGIWGDMYIELEMKTPKKLSEKEEDLIKQLMAETNFI